MIFLQLFYTFFKIGLFGFGGGYAMLSMIQGEVVTRYGWLTSPAPSASIRPPTSDIQPSSKQVILRLSAYWVVPLPRLPSASHRLS